MKKFVNKRWIAMALLAVAFAATAVRCGFAQATQSHPHGASTAATVPHMPRFRFENYTTANGLPDNHV
jgi:hypothetical protein